MKPATPGGTSRYLGFGAFRIDLHVKVLLRNGNPVPLTPKAIDTLLALVAQPGRIVTREELMETVWPNTAVEENNLSQNISMLRKVLGDSPDGGQYIQTVPKRGYRFVADVTLIEEPLAARSEDGHAASIARGLRRSPIVWIAVPLAALLSLLTVLVAERRQGTGQHPAARIRSLAVLPFVNVSPDPDRQYFADAMTDELITGLAEIRSLRVVSRTSVMRYKNSRDPLSRIAGQLGVDAVVEGSVLATGGRVRIAARLIQASTDRHLWAGNYEGELGHAVTLQDTVAREIVAQIRTKLTPHEGLPIARQRQVDPAAYQQYLLGRFFQNRRTLPCIRKSIAYFELSLARDPRYARAYAGLAASYALLGFYGEKADTVMPKARMYSLEALRLDDSLAEAHASLGAVKAVYDWDWSGAAEEFRSAIATNPNYVSAHHWYAVLDLAPQGRSGEAIEQMQQAQAIDPVSPVILTDLGWVHALAGHRREAAEAYNKALELDPDFLEAHDRLCQYYLINGPRQRWLTEFERAQTLGSRSAYAAALKRAYTASGFEGALRAATRLKSPEYGSAMYFSANGDRKKAISALERAYGQRESGLIYIKVDPMLAGLRSDLRFQAILRRMHLVEGVPGLGLPTQPAR